ncbi:hypothetical protein I4U23_015436 [Adineta vaga]|nr:hypothetical protein I4U23_015436 [Adineta vaga]
MWKMGDERSFRSEHDKKEREGETDADFNDEHITTNDQWDESVPLDLVMSYCNNPSDRRICLRMYKRLKGKNYRIYTETDGKHRLELMQKAIDKKCVMLVCMSAAYRSSKFCMAEVEYAFNHNSPIIPLIVENKYKVKGWLDHLIGGNIPFEFTENNFNTALTKLIQKIDDKLQSG